MADHHRLAGEGVGPGGGEEQHGIGHVVHAGRTTALAEGRIEDAAGKLYAFATTTCLIKRAGRD